MDITKLTIIVSLLIALSIASERLVEIIKGFIPWLNQANADAMKEGWRNACIHLLATVSGIVTALLSSSIIEDIIKQLFCTKENPCPQNWNALPSIIALGLLASGGSGFWNSILEYLVKVKDLKKIQIEKEKPTPPVPLPPQPTP